MPSAEHGPSTPLKAALLRAAVGGLYALEADVQLLVGHGFWTQQLWRAGLIKTSVDGGATHPLYADVQWSQAVKSVKDGGLGGASSDRKVLRAAARLADGAPAYLLDTLCRLDRDNLRLVRCALNANGAHQHVLVAREGLVSGVEAAAPRSTDANPSGPLGQATSGQG